MPKPKIFTALTHRAYGGLLRELITPVKIRIPQIFKGLNHDYIETKALWDTGATNTVISYRLAKDLGIPPIGKAKSIGVHGEEIVDKFMIDMLLMERVNFTSWEVTSGELSSKQADMLIGMDVIALGDFCITQERNAQGIPCTIFSFRLPSAEIPIDFYKEINDQNKVQAEKARNRARRAEYQKNNPKKKPRGKR